MGKCCQPVNEVVRHVQELKLIGSGRERGAHDEVHLHSGKHRAKGVELSPQLPICTSVLHVQVGKEGVIGLLYCIMQGLVRGDDTLALAVHVPSKFLQQCSEQNDSISQRILQLFN